MKLISISLCCFAVLIAGCQSQTTKQTAPALDNESIVQVHSNSDFTFSLKGDSGPVNFSADNTALMTFKNIESSGTWLTKEDSICMSWAKFRSGSEKCFEVYDMGNNEYHYYSDGKYTHKYTKTL